MQFRAVSGSIGRVKATVEEICREVCRELRRNSLSHDLGDKRSIRHGAVVLQFVRVKSFQFRKPEKRLQRTGKLMRTVSEGRRESRHSTRRGRNRIKLAGFGVDFKMKLLPTDSETGRKMQRGTPSDGKGDGAHGLRIMFTSYIYDFINKEVRERF